MEQIPITFPSGSGDTALEGIWHPPTRRATNGAVIVLHGANFNKDSEPSISLCVGAANLGLTALRFDFRYVHTGNRAAFDETIHGVDDLLGAYNFLQGFGKEIKPKRLYLIGKSMGGLVALKLAQQAEYAPTITGVAVLGMLLFSPNREKSYWKEGLSGLKAPLLMVQGEHDPYANYEELKQFADTISVQTQIEIVPGTGHSYAPRPVLPDELTQKAAYEQNITHAVELTLAWLEKQDSIREDLRK